MSRLSLMAVTTLLFFGMVGSASAGTWVFTGSAGATNCGEAGYWDVYGICDAWGGSVGSLILTGGNTYHISHTVSASFDVVGCPDCNSSCAPGEGGSWIIAQTSINSAIVCSSTGTGFAHQYTIYTPPFNTAANPQVRYGIAYTPGKCCECSGSGVIIITNETVYTVSGNTTCVDSTELYIYDGGDYHYIKGTAASSYSFNIYGGESYRLLFDGAYYDFTCDGNEVFDYDACLYVYGYTCGVDNIKLYINDSGWVLDDSAPQALGYDVYEMQIVDGEDYKISFIDSTIDGDFVVHNQTFSCTGDHVLIDFDRCSWVYPPNGPPVPIYIWTGYDYNIVVFKDAHGNLIENSQLAIYDKTDSQYLQRWTDAADGYTLLGARFATDHDVRLSIRTFDGIFTLDTTYPANGSAPVGEEIITTTNWTVPIKYNLNVLPVDQYGVALFDVFCGLSEYTPLDPQAFWGMDLSDQGYVAVTNCSGFAMCDIIAEKEGYTDYKVEALNWTSKSALVKDYRHNVVMEEE